MVFSMINQLLGWIIRNNVETRYLHSKMCAKRVETSSFKINSLKALLLKVLDHTIIFQHQCVNANDFSRLELRSTLFHQIL